MLAGLIEKPQFASFLRTDDGREMLKIQVKRLALHSVEVEMWDRLTETQYAKAPLRRVGQDLGCISRYRGLMLSTTHQLRQANARPSVPALELSHRTCLLRSQEE